MLFGQRTTARCLTVPIKQTQQKLLLQDLHLSKNNTHTLNCAWACTYYNRSNDVNTTLIIQQRPAASLHRMAQ